MEIENLISVRSSEELRDWLLNHSGTEPFCWVIVSMSQKPDTLLYLDAVEQALCFGWIDSVKKKLSDNQLAQRLSPRSARSSWTELNKERVRRLDKLGLMTDEGRKVLPDMNPDSFRIDPVIEQRLQEDRKTYDHFLACPALYKRVRIDNIQSNKHLPELFQSRLDKFITSTKANQMYGQWHDHGRLLDY
ncbi:YdeI/OmpD-associated family protein [Paenibacillus kobensis]|uniref:YdeI/OmpD-associated family protein n=1 Tax=Paenibacillus kobensis TaxID=59841 RepID=UPI000FDB33A8|nr:YdeI/OmpD-associated family protein [Paenibacillus kobensis]